MSILFDNPPPAIGCGDPGDPIDFGCLFDGSGELAKTFAEAGNRQEMTILVRLKLAGPPASQRAVISANAGSNRTGILISNSRLELHGDGAIRCRSDALLRDYSEHTSVVLHLQSANANAAQRAAFFVDLKQIPVSFPEEIPLGWNSGFFSATQHAISGLLSPGDNRLSGGISEIIAIEGALVAPEEFDYVTSYGHVRAKRFAGTGGGAAVYGPKGFHLDFADPLDLGKDISGNGNHFTASGLTTGSQTKDTPSNAFNTHNPINSHPSAVLSGGNLTSTSAEAGNTGVVAGTMPVSSGRYYWEVTVDALGNYENAIGVIPAQSVVTQGNVYNYPNGVGAGEVVYSVEGPLSNNSGHIGGILARDGVPSQYGERFEGGDIIGVLVDCDQDVINFSKNGVWQGEVPLCTKPFLTTNTNIGGSVLSSNFGQRDFAHAIPEKAKTLSTGSVPCPPIINPDDYFTHRIKAGGDGVSDLPFNPSVSKALVVSARMDTDDPCLITDTVNGAGMAWDASTNATGLMARPNGITAFNPNGYSIGTDPAYQGNRLDLTWRASPKAGFDIVTINHTTGTPTTVPHLAGGVIEYAWCLPHSGGQSKRIFHHRLGNDRYFPMDAEGPSVSDPGWISSTANTITLGASMPTGVYTLPVWRSVEQFSSFGRYAPNNSANGPFIPLDFSPRLFMPSGNGPNGMRAIFVDELVTNGGNDKRLAFEAAAVAQTAYEYCDFLSNGVKARGVYTPINYSDTDFYYPAAFARTPGKFARAR